MRWVSAGLALAVSISGGCASRPHRQGPMPVRNQHPAQLTVLHLPPARAAVLGAGDVNARADTAYSNLWLSGSGSGGRSWSMDGEYLRFATSLRVGLGAGLEAAAELPVAHTTGGFLDSFIIKYHEFVGSPDQDRTGFPNNQFDVEARVADRTAWTVEREDLMLLDVPLWLTCNLTDPAAGLGVAVRGGVELPTGDDRSGYGNGEVDFSAGVLLEYEALGVGWYGHLQHTFAGSPDHAQAAGLPFSDVTSAGLGAEVDVAAGLRALVQVEWETSTLRDLGLQVAAREQLMLWIGARIAWHEDWDVEIGFGEDLQGLVSPDFSAWLGMSWAPDGGSR